MNDNKGIWIPEAVLCLPDLTPTEKMLFALIVPMTFTEPCWAGNGYMSERIGVSEQTISNNLGSLHDKGYIRIFVDRVGGNSRQIWTYILENTLYKYIGNPLSKFDRPLYKDFIEGIQNLYRASIKSLDTLYKDFIFTYKDDSKVDNKEEYNKVFTPVTTRRDKLLFWSVLKINGGIYKDRKTYSQAVKKMTDDSLFERFWQLYDKKEERKKCREKWDKLTYTEKQKILEHVPAYVKKHADPEYRKYPIRYLSGELWKETVQLNSSPVNRQKQMVY